MYVHLKQQQQKVKWQGNKWLNKLIKAEFQILFVDFEAVLWPKEEKNVFYFSNLESGTAFKGEENRRMLEGANKYILVFKGCRLMFFKSMEFYLWPGGAQNLEREAGTGHCHLAEVPIK